MKRLLLMAASLAMASGLAAASCLAAHAQYSAYSGRLTAGSGGVTPATGDSRPLVRPAFPPVCAQVAATKFLILTNTKNVNPFALGCGSTSVIPFGTLGCTGASSYEPSSTTPAFTSDETLDTAAVQTALDACPAGQSVEIVTGAGGQRAMVTGRIAIPTGVGLTLDAGIWVDGSLTPADYGGTGCGTVSAGTSNCNPWITAAGTSGSGIYGYGLFNPRGWDHFNGSATAGWYPNRIQAYINRRGSAQHGSPAGKPNGAGNNSFGPTAVNLVGAGDFKWYMAGIQDSGDFGIQFKGATGGTFWGAKIHNPFNVANTDAWDPVDAIDVSLVYSSLASGDNNVAVKASGSATRNITVRYNQFGAGIGTVVGGDTTNGVSNALFSDNVYNANPFNDQGEGFGIGTNSSFGGTVDTITFQNSCLMNVPKAMRFFTNFDGGSGSLPPTITNLLVNHTHVLKSVAPYAAGNSGTYTYQGLDLTHLMTGQISDLTIDGLNQGVQSQGIATTNQFGSFLIGPGAVDASVLGQLAAPPATSVATRGSGAPVTPYPCTYSMSTPISAELNLKTAISNNNQTFTGAPPYTLTATIRTLNSISTKEQTQPNGAVQFKDNGATIATVFLGAVNTGGDYAFWKVNTAAPGTHLYTANYTGDSAYSDVPFGSITVIVP